MVEISEQLSNLAPPLTKVLSRPPGQSKKVVRRAPVLQKQVRLGEADVAELCRRYDAGESVPVLQWTFGINRETVLLHLQRAGVSRSPNVRKLSDDWVNAAAVVSDAGSSLRTTAAQFGVSERTMRRELTAAGHTIRKRNG